MTYFYDLESKEDTKGSTERRHTKRLQQKVISLNLWMTEKSHRGGEE